MSLLNATLLSLDTVLTCYVIGKVIICIVDGVINSDY